MTTHPKYLGKSIGLARTVAEVDLSGGEDLALEIVNFHLSELGFLDSTFRIMPLIPSQWRGAAQPAAFGTVYAMAFARVNEAQELLFLTSVGVFRYAPSRRAVAGANPGLEQVFLWTFGNSTSSVVPQSVPRFPPQIETAGNRVYFTFCDGGGAWVWDGERVRAFGHTARPGSVDAEGPQRNDAGSANGGGFSASGRVGDISSDWTTPAGDVVGGIDTFRRQYAVVYENTDGAYSATSTRGGIVTIRQTLADPAGTPPIYVETLRRRFRLTNFPTPPLCTSALILLATRNLERTTDTGEMRFAHRLPVGASEYVDDIPDGELGGLWAHREPTPAGFFFLKFFGGSMWLLRTDGAPSRVWWSEQTNLSGPTPESVMEGHFRDVFPSAGAITGALVAGIRSDNPAPAMMIGSERAMHYVTGSYPHWQFGTLHARAGLEGPDLIQNCPDGTVLWYGCRTFWQMQPDGRIVDVGQLVRRRLGRVNHASAHMGTSWVDTRRAEVVFSIPSDDSTRPSWGFLYDYRSQGFRFLDDVTVDAAATHDGAGLVLLAGTYNGTRTVFAYGRGYPGYAAPAPLAIYGTGWISFQGVGPNMQAPHNARDSVFTLAERGEGQLTLTSSGDWNDDDRTEYDPVSLAHPENDDIPYYAPATHAATYGTSVWRRRRMFVERHGIDVARHVVFRLRVSGTSPAAIMNIDAYGPRVGLPTAGAPEPGPHSED